MRTIRLSSIVIKPNRQRQEFEPEALQELKTSIEDFGLMHPPVLRQEGDDWVLVAGERRIRAITEIFELGGTFICDGVTYGGELETAVIPFLSLGELSQLEAMEAELDENLKRRDLTWQEHAAAVAELHNLRAAQKVQHNQAVLAGKDPEGMLLPAQTVADTARELTGRSDGSYQDNIRQELIVAKHLDNPAIAKAKSAKEAFKILKLEEARATNIELAKVVGATFNADLHELHNMNCLEYMKLCAARADKDKFDVILTDPPYGMGAHEFGDGAGRLSGIEHHYDDSYESWLRLMSGPEGWCALSFKVAKPQAHAYVFCDIDNFGQLKDMMREAGWYVFRTPLTNIKRSSGRVPLPDRGPRRQTEWILYAIKGDKQVTHIYPDIIESTADDSMTHGAQKPVAVYQNLLQRSVKPGDRVADFFAGSGTIFEAAHTMKCYAVGTEMNPEYYGMCLQRLKKLKQLETPALF